MAWLPLSCILFYHCVAFDLSLCCKIVCMNAKELNQRMLDMRHGLKQSVIGDAKLITSVRIGLHLDRVQTTTVPELLSEM